MAAEGSVTADLGGYVNRVTKLLRLDAALLSIETKENLIAVAVTLGLVVGALALAHLGIIILLIAAVLLLIQIGLNPALAALGVAVALFAAAGLMVFIGLQRLRVWTIVPRRTLAQFRANLDALRASLRHEPEPNR